MNRNYEFSREGNGGLFFNIDMERLRKTMRRVLLLLYETNA
jgi:hypothetical protein